MAGMTEEQRQKRLAELDLLIDNRRKQLQIQTAQPVTSGVQTTPTPPNESPVGFGTRMAASFLRGDQRDNYLSRNLPEGFTLDPGGQTATGPQGPQPIDPSGFDVGDLADVVGDVPEIAGGATAGTAGTLFGLGLGIPTGPGAALTGATIGMGSAAAGSAAGDAFRQGVGQMIEPAPFDYGSVGDAAMMGGAGEALGPVAGKVAAEGVGLGLRGLRRMTGGHQLSDIGQQAVTDAQRLGIPEHQLPIGTTTDSRMTLGLDSQLRRSPITGGMFDEGNQVLQTSMEEGLQGVRRKVGGSIADNAVLESGIEPAIVRDALIVNHAQQTQAIDRALDVAHEQFTNAVGRPLNQIQIPTPALEAVRDEAARDLASQPALSQLPEFGAMKRFFAGAQFDNLDQVMELRRIAGQMIENPSTADTGRRLYAAVLDDLEHGLLSELSLLKGSTAVTSYKKMLNTARRQFEVGQSTLVKRLFPNGEPNVFVLGEVADRISGSGVGVDDIKLLKERLGLGAQGQTGIDMANRLKVGRERVPLPKTEKGEFLFDQIKQLYLDNLLAKHATGDTGALKTAGRQFYKTLFGTPKAMAVSKEIFGDATEDVRAFANLLRDVGVSERFFAGSPTAPLTEMRDLISVPGAVGAASRIGVARQFVSPHLGGKGAMIGREFFQRGELPDLQAWLHRHRKLAAATRVTSQTAVRGSDGSR